MKKIIVLLTLLAFLFLGACSSNKASSEGKPKKEKKAKAQVEQKALLLDEARLENAATGVTAAAEIAYANGLALNAISLFEGVNDLFTGAGSDFNKLYNLFNSANEDVNYSNEIMLQALNLRKDVVASRAEVAAMSSGNAGQLMAQKSAEADSILTQMAASGAQLNEKQKVWLRVGMIRLGTALAKEVALGVSIKQYVDNVKKLPKMNQAAEAKNLPKAADVISKLPGMISAQAGTLGKMIKIAKANNIEIPKGVKLP